MRVIVFCSFLFGFWSFDQIIIGLARIKTQYNGTVEKPHLNYLNKIVNLN